MSQDFDPKNPQGVVEPAVGQRTSIAIRPEKEWAAFYCETGEPTENWVFMPQTGNSIDGDIELLEDPTIAGGRFRREGLAGSDSIEGSIDITVDVDLIGYPIYYALGGLEEEEIVEGEVYSHVFYGNDLDHLDAELPSFSIYRNLDKFAQRMMGARTNSLSFDQSEAEVLETSWDLIVRSEQECPEEEEPETEQVIGDPFVYRDAELLVDGEVAGNVVDISFEINNNLETEYTINSGMFIGVLVALQREITGSMVIKYEDPSLYNAYIEGEDMELELTYYTGEYADADGDYEYIFRVHLPLVKLDTVPIDVGGGDEIVTQDVDFSAYYDENAVFESTKGNGDEQTEENISISEHSAQLAEGNIAYNSFSISNPEIDEELYELDYETGEVTFEEGEYAVLRSEDIENIEDIEDGDYIEIEATDSIGDNIIGTVTFDGDETSVTDIVDVINDSVDFDWDIASKVTGEDKIELVSDFAGESAIVSVESVSLSGEATLGLYEGDYSEGSGLDEDIVEFDATYKLLEEPVITREGYDIAFELVNDTEVGVYDGSQLFEEGEQ